MRLAAALAGAVSVAAFGAVACTTPTDSSPGRAPAALVPPSAAAMPTVPLPPPETLADVMYRLADPAVSGSEKLPLMQDSAPPDAAVFDRFAAALRDSGFAPVTFTASDTRWADAPPLGAAPQDPRVLATITVTTSNTGSPSSTDGADGPSSSNRADGSSSSNRADGSSSSDRAGDFVFPMAFHPGPDGWQLTRDTAEMLLAFGNER